MADYRTSVSLAEVEHLERRGSDIVLSLRNLDRKRLSFYVTVVLVGVTGVESVDQRNDLVRRDLDEVGPGWRVRRLDFDGRMALLGVYQTDMHHDTYPVLHSINCQRVEVKKRLAVLRTLGHLLY